MRKSRLCTTVLVIVALLRPSTAWSERIELHVLNSGPTAPMSTADSVWTPSAQGASTVLGQVPTSTWTYGCSATSAGMIFGYYDRIGFSNMYAGSTNGGIAPLTNLGQGISGTPISGSCSIIATQNGFDGRTTNGHVDDYWKSYGSSGPDPWVNHGWTEHAWGDCTADYLGTNQWKWNFQGSDGLIDSNVDGSTIVFYNPAGAKLYDYVPPASSGLPQTEVCHGLRLFAESRGYSVYQNYTQTIYDSETGKGFSFNDYKSEIDAGRPVMIQVAGHSMVGVGYDETGGVQNVVLHDTWDNANHEMTWGGTYSDMQHYAVTVIQLNTPAASVGEPLDFGDVIVGATVSSQNLTVEETGDLTRLDYQLGANPAGFAVNGAGTSHFVTAGNSQNHAVTLNTAAAGDYTDSSLAVNNTAVTSATLATATLNARVLDHSEASFSDTADLDTLVLDFGTVSQASAASPLSFSIANLVSTADLTVGLDLTSITPSGDSTVLTTDLATFGDLVAGSANGFWASFDTGSLGSFLATYTLGVRDTTLPGWTFGTSLVLTLMGTVSGTATAVPEPACLGWLAAIALGVLVARRRRTA